MTRKRQRQILERFAANGCRKLFAFTLVLGCYALMIGLLNFTSCATLSEMCDPRSVLSTTTLPYHINYHRALYRYRKVIGSNPVQA